MGQLLCGKNSVIEGVKNNLPIKKVWVAKPLGFQTDIPVSVVSRQELDKMTSETHQGYVAELKEINYYNIDEILKDKPKKVLMLDHIQDPHNFGAIIRSANAAGVKHIIIPKDRAVAITPTVLKVASGGIVGMKIIRVGSLTDSIYTLKKNDFWVYTTALEGGVDVDTISFNDPTVLIVGNEGKGVSRPLLKLSDQNVFIKMEGTVQSLNVSVATGIILFKL